MTAAMLRLEAGRDPLNSQLTALIGELSTRSPQFRRDWAGHDVHSHRTGQKVFRHPEVGQIEVTFDVFAMPDETGLSIVAYSVEAASESADRFALLASWAATRHSIPSSAPTPPATTRGSTMPLPPG